MKRKSTTFLLIVLMSMVGANAFAAFDTGTKVQVGNLYYYLDTSNLLAEVTSMPSGKYSGVIDIPTSFTYSNNSYSVTSIGQGAFQLCGSLTSVTIPNSVTSIGNSAFSGCFGLASVTIPNSVTSIGNSAFYGCSSLTSVHITDIAAWCNISFGGYTSNPLYCAHHLYMNGSEITDLVIPNSVTSIGNSAFYYCTGLTSVTIGNSVTSIGTSAFGNCSGLTSVTIPNSVTSIESNAFSGCSGLTSVTIPNSVTSIGYRAFYNCSSLTSVTIPNSVEQIFEGAFYGCNSLTSITIPNSVTMIEVTAFANCSGLTSMVVDSGNTVYDSRDNCNAIIETATNILISGCQNTVIPSNVTRIGFSAFGGCSSLTSITIPNSVTCIDANAFDGCSGLTSLTIPNSVWFISGQAFIDCSGLTSVTIPNSVEQIFEGAFYGCNSLTSITIPNSVTSIDCTAFGGCSGLTSIVVESGNAVYDSRDNCNAIIETATNTLICGCQNTAIPNSVTSIGARAFQHCSSLTSITIPNSVTSIGAVAFYGCSSLTSITIPNSVTSIGESAFADCNGLTSVEIPNSVTSIGDGTFQACTGLTSVIIPNSVTSIGNSAFYDCTGLTSITIPNSVTSIGNRAFYGCTDLTSVTIPNGVTSIGGYAFYGCSSLTEVTVDIETPLTITQYVFSNRANATLYVPKGCVSAYQNAQYWQDFKSIEEKVVSIRMATDSGAPRTMIGYSSKYALDFTNVSDVRAYIVVGYNDSKEAMLVHVDVVPPYTGLVIKTNNPGVVVDVPIATEDYYYVNLLVPVVELQTIQPTETIDNEEFTNFVVGKLNNGDMGFVRVTSLLQRQNKSYLRVPTRLYNAMTNAPALGGIGMEIMDDETTGLYQINHGQLKEDNVYYDLNGRRVEHPAKGLYIVNGKKVIVK